LRIGDRLGTNLRNQTAIVTGAGRGIGAAIALAFAREGASLILCSRTLHEAEGVAGQARVIGASAVAHQVDVSDYRQVERMVTDAISRFGKVEILVNNAGIYGSIGPTWKNDPSEWAKTITVNLLGAMHCIRAVVPHMIEAGKGKIINIAGGGEGAFARFSAYACSKSALVRLNETLAEEVREYNIQVNAIAPGAVNTRLLDQVLAAGQEAGMQYEKAKKQKASGGVSPDKTAQLAVFLASESSMSLTGRLISAVWDDWQNLDAERLANSSLYRVRRIDGVRFLASKQEAASQ